MVKSLSKRLSHFATIHDFGVDSPHFGGGRGCRGDDGRKKGGGVVPVDGPTVRGVLTEQKVQILPTYLAEITKIGVELPT
jgi:hypothetical protein